MSFDLGKIIAPTPTGLKTVSIHDPGLAYVIGDIVAVTGGNGDAQVLITGVDVNGRVTACRIYYATTSGTAYVDATNVATSGGSGDQLFTVDITCWGSLPIYVTETGLSFPPKAVLVVMFNGTLDLYTTTNPSYFCRGAITAGEQFACCSVGTQKNGDWTSAKTNNSCILLRDFNNVLTNATKVSLNNDGFTIRFDTLDNNSYVGVWVAFGGDITLAQIKEVSIPLVDAFHANHFVDCNQNVDFLLAMGVGHQNTGNLSGQLFTQFVTGAICTTGDTGTKGVTKSHVSSSWGTNAHARGLQSQFSRYHYGSSIQANYNIVTPVNTGYITTVQPTPFQQQQEAFHQLQFSNITTKILSFNIPTSAQTVHYTGFGFSPEWLIFLTRASTGSPGVTTISGYNHGFSDGTQNFVFNLTSRRGSALGITFDSPTINFLNNYCIYQYLMNDFLTATGYCTSRDADGFTVVFDFISSALTQPMLVAAGTDKKQKGAVLNYLMGGI